METFVENILKGIRQWVNGKLEDISFVISNHINELTDRVETIEGGIASKVIDDSIITTLKTWSSSKINSELSGKQDTLTAGQNIDITGGNISAKGYLYDETKGAFATKFLKDEYDGGGIGTNTASGNYGSFAEGYGNTASGEYGSHAEGFLNTASGDSAHVEGQENTATHSSAHAEGRKTNATNNGAHSEGTYSDASGVASHAEGYGSTNYHNIASGDGSHTEGVCTRSQNKGEHAEGCSNVSHKASNTYGDAGNTQHSIGIGTHYNSTKNAVEVMQNGDYYLLGVGGYDGMHIKTENGYENTKTLQDAVNSKQDTLTAGTNINIDNGTISAEGYKYDANRKSLAEGDAILPLSNNSHSEGNNTGAEVAIEVTFNVPANSKVLTASGSFSSNTNIKLGAIIATVINGETIYNRIDGINTDNNTITVKNAFSATALTNAEMKIVKGIIAVGNYAHIEGYNNTASGNGAHAEGSGTISSGSYTHTEGSGTIAKGIAAHAEGKTTKAIGKYTHTEGERTEANADWSHAEGVGTKANGTYSHAEGTSTLASGIGAHAEGVGYDGMNPNIASGKGSHTEGFYTTAQNQGEHAEGSSNLSHKVSDTYGNSGNTIHSVGIGTSISDRKNAFEIMQNGDMYVLGIGGYQGTNTKVQDATIKTLQEVINGKGDTLTAGEGIEISGNTISATPTDNATNDDIDFMFTKEIKLIREQTNDANYIDWLVNTRGETMVYNGQTYYKWVSWANDGYIDGVSWTLIEHPNIIVLTNTLDVQLPFNTNSPEFEYWINIDGETENNYIKGDYTQKTFQ